MNVRFICLGHSDPETTFIEEVLQGIVIDDYFAGYDVPILMYATDSDGNRVHTGNSRGFRYWIDGQSENPAVVVETPHWKDTLFIKCKPATGVEYDLLGCIQHKDLGAADYWRGSVVGQVFNLLDITITKEACMVAAGAHCLHHAYAGRCQGIDPQSFYNHRVTERAQFRDLPEQDVINSISRACAVVKAAPRMKIGDEYVHVVTNGECIKEASAFLGIPCMYHMSNGKVALIAADSNTVEVFMESPGLKDTYGFPNRGFAGAYLVEGFTFNEFIGRKDFGERLY